MAFDPVADLSLLFADFGVESVVGAVTTQGIWDQEYRAAQAAESVVEATASALLVRTSEIPDVAHGQTVTVDSTEYTLTGVEPDGDGVTRLVVSRY